MLIVHDPRCAEFGSAHRPERPTRVTATSALLLARHPEWRWAAPGEVSDDVLLLAHTRAHLDRLGQPLDFDEDTPYFDGIVDHARRSVAAAMIAMQAALRGGEKSLSLMRPPGHHATAGQAMGFCYLNQAAVAAFAARALGAERVAVWDFDAHHGNGTEAILDGRPGFLFCSVHQFPGYPGTGTRNTDNCRNWVVGPHGPRERHLHALQDSWRQIVAFNPDLVVLSAGFDGYVHDPVASLSLEIEDFATIGSWVRDSAIPATGLLEGGYSDDLPLLVDAFLGAWAG